MKTNPFRCLLALLALCALVLAGLFVPASAAPGDSTRDPVILTSLADLPAGAVLLNQSTQACSTTSLYSVTTPGQTEVSHQEFRWPLEKRTYTPAVSEVKEYTFDKFVQRQKARWNGNTYIGPISAGYPGSYTWRDAGFAPVTNTTGVVPTAPGPVRGEFIHNNGGTWYFTLFYEYRKISERVVTAASPAKFSAWTFDTYTAWSTSSAAPPDPDGQSGETNPLNLRRVSAPVQTQTVVDSAATPSTVKYYSYNDGETCDVVITETPTPTPEPEPSGKVSVESRCTGTTTFTYENTGDVAITVKMRASKKRKGPDFAWDKSVSLAPGRSGRLVKRLPNRAVVTIFTPGDFDSLHIPKPCPETPHKTTHTGKRVG